MKENATISAKRKGADNNDTDFYTCANEVGVEEVFFKILEFFLNANMTEAAT